ncbi:hypothetical protein PENSPDRAFT_679541 [Peniophora sp. CONT]|nr:hypothetical protein PENSPDRAFT_679541 [Peniophora sp. CONT]
MDSIINKGKAMLNNQSGTQGSAGLNSGVNAGQATSGGNEDYVDKGLDSLERKQGINMNRNTNEKITDGARNFFEKTTGRDIPDKFSN